MRVGDGYRIRIVRMEVDAPEKRIFDVSAEGDVEDDLVRVGRTKSGKPLPRLI